MWSKDIADRNKVIIKKIKKVMINRAKNGSENLQFFIYAFSELRFYITRIFNLCWLSMDDTWSDTSLYKCETSKPYDNRQYQVFWQSHKPIRRYKQNDVNEIIRTLHNWERWSLAWVGSYWLNVAITGSKCGLVQPDFKYMQAKTNKQKINSKR